VEHKMAGVLMDYHGSSVSATLLSGYAQAKPTYKLRKNIYKTGGMGVSEDRGQKTEHVVVGNQIWLVSHGCTNPTQKYVKNRGDGY